MSQAVVQTLGSTSTSGGGPLQSSAFGSSVTTGNTIIAFVWVYGNSEPTSVTDTASNTYAKDATVQDGTDTNVRCSVWRSSNVTGGSTFKLTVNAPGGVSFLTISAVEISGQENSSPIDGAGSTNSGPNSSPPSTGSFTTTNANDIILVTFASAIGASVDVPVPSGYTQIAQENTSGFADGSAAYKIVAATQSGIDPTWGANPGYQWAAIGIAYKAAAGGASGNPWYYYANQALCSGGF